MFTFTASAVPVGVWPWPWGTGVAGLVAGLVVVTTRGVDLKGVERNLGDLNRLLLPWENLAERILHTCKIVGRAQLHSYLPFYACAT